MTLISTTQFGEELLELDAALGRVTPKDDDRPVFELAEDLKMLPIMLDRHWSGLDRKLDMSPRLRSIVRARVARLIAGLERAAEMPLAEDCPSYWLIASDQKGSRLLFAVAFLQLQYVAVATLDGL